MVSSGVGGVAQKCNKIVQKCRHILAVQSKPTNSWLKNLDKSKCASNLSKSMSHCDKFGAPLDCLVYVYTVQLLDMTGKSASLCLAGHFAKVRTST